MKVQIRLTEIRTKFVTVVGSDIESCKQYAKNVSNITAY